MGRLSSAPYASRLSKWERESGTARLEAAVEACRAALETFAAAPSSLFQHATGHSLDPAMHRETMACGSTNARLPGLGSVDDLFKIVR